MKRHSDRDCSSPRASGKRQRERDRERGRERDGGSRREEGPTDSGSNNRSSRYRKNSEERGTNRSGRSDSRDRFSSRREERSGGGGDSSNHRPQHPPEPLTSRNQGRAGKPLKPEPALSVTSAGEYKTLLVSGLGAQLLPDVQLEDAIFRQFNKYGDISVKLSHTPELGRVAYVNFRHPQDAKDARNAKGGRLELCDRPVVVEPVFLQSRSRTPPEPAYIPTHGYQYKQRSLSPRLPRHNTFTLEAAGLSRERERAVDYYGMQDERTRPYGITVAEEDLMPEDDQRATRNLFIGNVDPAIKEIELRRAFEKYGLIEEVVIKNPAKGVGGSGGVYAFLKFHNLDMAHRAKVAMSGQIIGRNAIKIGYGKVNPTTRLWVGGLGPNTSLAALAREFDRFGSIKTIDYVKGDNFAYIQYESLDAAQAACSKMRGYPLGGADRRLRVDFARTEESRYPQQYQPTLLPVHYELLPESYSRHRNLEQDLRVRDRTPPHLLYSDRDRVFAEGDWTSPAKVSERRNSLENYSRVARSRSGEHWGSDGERTVPKPWEERRKRRSLSGERGRAPLLLFEDKCRTKATVPTVERSSPDRTRKENHVANAVPEKDQNIPVLNNKHVPDEKKRLPTPESSQQKKKESEHNHRTIEPAPKPPPELKCETKKPKTLSEYAQTLSHAWSGHLVLKNSCFPTSMHVLEGDTGLPSALLKDHTSGGKLTQLKIAQRLRLDQPKLDEVTRRIKQGTPGGYAVLLATQTSLVGAATGVTLPAELGLQRRLLRNLVSYLKQKQAAGVISLPVGGAKVREGTGMLYAFPPCDFSQQYLQAALRTLGSLEEEHMIMVIVKDSA
ncbi:putative RNA-binding protein 15B [Ambystoma mexicanum]|uniref:putative RNA-binding protein 15B n=1 Tax=Ambystoma mexicanum TaxID=8296 RepID=UPI0037E7D041